MIRNALTRSVNRFNIFRRFSNQFVDDYRLHSQEEGYFWKSGYGNVTIPENFIDEYVWKNINKWQNHIAIECGVTGRKYTYSKLRDHSAALAVRLQKKFNLQHGDVIAICLPNCPEYPIALLGAIEAGLTVTTINPLNMADAIARQIELSNTKCIIGSISGYSELKKACDIAKMKIDIAIIQTTNNQPIPTGAVNFQEIIATENIDFSYLRNDLRDTSDICLLPFSSGTTGLPKGVMITHKNITSNCKMLDVKHPKSRLYLTTTNNFQEVLPSVVPFFHIYGLMMSLLSNLSIGCKVISLPKFHPNSFLSCLLEHKPTILPLVPPMVLFLGNSAEVTNKHLKHVRILFVGAAPVGSSDIDRVKEKAANFEFLHVYGLTEASPLAFFGHTKSNNYATIGWPVSNTEAKIVKIDDSKYIGVDKDEVGELLLRGPHIMKGYFHNKEATDETIVCNGWLRTGDIACYDQDGLFYIKDRLKELIKVKGFQVPPAELEEILRNHPKVNDTAVIGIPHPTSGEVPRAFVVPKPGVTISEKELQDFVANRVIEYKQITGGMQIIDVIPRNPSGKILRRELKKLL